MKAHRLPECHQHILPVGQELQWDIQFIEIQQVCPCQAECLCNGKGDLNQRLKALESDILLFCKRCATSSATGNLPCCFTSLGTCRTIFSAVSLVGLSNVG